MPKEITLGQLIDSMEKNGFKQAYGTLMAPKHAGEEITRKKDVGAACALGQGMLNLNIKTLVYKGSIFNFRKLVDYVANLNDNEKLTPAEIARNIREVYKDNLDLPLMTYSFREDANIGRSLR